ncbi:ABC transporter permease [Clostridia bacterium]|nr:ABC transporter permease [Clostridia bacterium]
MKKKNRGGGALLWELSKGGRRLYAVAFLAMMTGIICNYITPQIIRFTVDSVVGGLPVSQEWLAAVVDGFGGVQALRGSFWAIAVILLLVAAIGGLANFISGRTRSMASEGIIRRLRDRLYAHIMHLPYSWHVKVQTGDIIQRCTSDVGVVHDFLANQILDMARTILLVGFAYAILFPMNFVMALASVIFLPITFCYSFFFLGKVSARFQEADEAEGLLMSIAQENLTGVRVVRAFGRERYEVERFDRQNNKYADLWMDLGKVLGVFWGMGDLITGLQMIAICVTGAFQAAQGQITVGGFMVFLIYNSLTIWPVRGLGRILSEMSKTGVSIGRLQEILLAKPEEDAPDALVSPLDGDIVFKNVSFSYGAQKVLDDVSFTVKKGSTLGILGGTGSGKTTIAHLLCRLYDLEEGRGEITIGGIPIEKFSRKWLRKNIGIVLQEPFLFSRSIKDNIAALSPHRPLDDVKRAAAVACVDDSIEQFAEGYDTVIGERGVTLSGGQKQRVAIARTVINDPPVMVFDDSLSAVDTQTDASIREALSRRTSGVTTIIIAYRITSLSQADTIIVLDEGKIAEMGSHSELMTYNGVYRRVHDMQESIVEEEVREA